MPELSSVPSFLEGMYLALNAVPDVRLMLDAPVGCLFKSERLGLNHDLCSTLFDPLGSHRVIPTIEHPQQLVSGTEATLRGMIRKVVEASRPSVLFLSEVTAVLLTGNDGHAIAAEMSRECGVPVAYIRPENLEGDFLEGYETLAAGLADVIVTGPAAGGLTRRSVAVVGYMPDRLEEDHRANRRELAGLLEALGLECVCFWLDGSDTAALAQVARAETLIAFPLGREVARRIAERTGARVVEADLPLGLDGTARFLRRVAAETEAPAGRAEAVVDAALRHTVPVLDRVREQFLQGRSVAVAATPDLAPGLVGLASEMGMTCPLVAARCRSESRLGPVREALARLDHPGSAAGGGWEGHGKAAGGGWVGPTEILWDFPRSAFRETLQRLHEEQPVDLVIGTTSEAHAADTVGAGLVEVGYPSYRTHALTPRPTLGFAGTLRLVEEMVNAWLRTERGE